MRLLPLWDLSLSLLDQPASLEQFDLSRPLSALLQRNCPLSRRDADHATFPEGRLQKRPPLNDRGHKLPTEWPFFLLRIAVLPAKKSRLVYLYRSKRSRRRSRAI